MQITISIRKDENVEYHPGNSVPNRGIIKRAFLKGIEKRGLDDWLDEMVAHWENWEIYKQKVNNAKLNQRKKR